MPQTQKKVHTNNTDTEQTTRTHCAVYATTRNRTPSLIHSYIRTFVHSYIHTFIHSSGVRTRSAERTRQHTTSHKHAWRRRPVSNVALACLVSHSATCPFRPLSVRPASVDDAATHLHALLFTGAAVHVELDALFFVGYVVPNVPIDFHKFMRVTLTLDHGPVLCAPWKPSPRVCTTTFTRTNLPREISEGPGFVARQIAHFRKPRGPKSRRVCRPTCNVLGSERWFEVLSRRGHDGFLVFRCVSERKSVSMG